MSDIPGNGAASPGAIAAALLKAGRDGPPTAACTVVSATGGANVAVGAKMLVNIGGEPLGALGGGPLEAAVRAAAEEAIPRHVVTTLAFTPAGELLEGRRAVDAAPEKAEILIEIVEPAPTLLVVGGGHVGKALGEVGAFLGMEVAILDDREEYANVERFPYEARVICGDVAEELDRFPIDSNTYIVLVSRGHKVDELALQRVAERGAAYVGMIGSQRRTRTVLEHLRAESVDPEALAKVFTPIGLDIGAETPEEIAVAVMAEIIMARNGGTARPMSDHGRSLADAGSRRPGAGAAAVH